MTYDPASTFASGAWRLTTICDDHGVSRYEGTIEFTSGRVTGHSDEFRLDGVYDAITGQCAFTLTKSDQDEVEHWDGVADGAAIVGSFRDAIPLRNRKGPCRGPFFMQRVL